jgi:hypothetical protein
MALFGSSGIQTPFHFHGMSCRASKVPTLRKGFGGTYSFMQPNWRRPFHDQAKAREPTAQPL